MHLKLPSMSHWLLWFQIIITILVFNSVGAGNDNSAVNPKKSPRKEGLYSSEDEVIILNEKNIQGRVYGQSTLWVVQFYNSWCGHCIHFAPTWKAFAANLKGWRQVVSIGAVDCSTDENLRICRNFDVVAYPSVMLIPPNFQHDLSKSRVQTIKTQDKQKMKDIILKYISDPDFAVPSSWPCLKPLKRPGGIWKTAKERHKLVVIVFEEERSTVGMEVMLDVLDYPEILVGRMLKKDSEKLGIIKYPSVYKINETAHLQRLISGTGLTDSDRRRFVDKLLSISGHLDSEGRRIKISRQTDNQAGERDSDVSFQHLRSKTMNNQQGQQSVRVYMQDLESTLSYALRREVGICKTIQGTKLKALHNFVSVLEKYFPGRPQVMQFLKRLAEYLRKVDMLTGESWISAINDIQNQKIFLPEQVRWVGCQGRLPHYRGYPCGIWTLFHTLTVAAYDKTEGVNAQEVPLAIRGYIEHFFGCQECAKNFLKAATNLEIKIRQPVDAVLWLWAAHNRVNKRLHKDITEDPQYPKIQFPSVHDCPTCRPQQESDSDHVPWWNSSAVLSFLLKLYGKKNILQISSRPGPGDTLDSVKSSKDGAMDWLQAKQHQEDLRMTQHKQHFDGQEITGWEMNRKIGFVHTDSHLLNSADSRYLRGGTNMAVGRLDIGLYVLFYIISSIILAYLYFHLIFHKRHKIPCTKCL